MLHVFIKVIAGIAVNLASRIIDHPCTVKRVLLSQVLQNTMAIVRRGDLQRVCAGLGLIDSTIKLFVRSMHRSLDPMASAVLSRARSSY
jgi:hypothetical protein